MPTQSFFDEKIPEAISFIFMSRMSPAVLQVHIFDLKMSVLAYGNLHTIYSPVSTSLSSIENLKN